MNEQEKTLQGIIEFCQWLIPNAKQLGLEQSKSIAMIKQAQTPNDIINGMNSLYQELGEEQFADLAQAFQQSKTQNIKKAKKGTKIDCLVSKFKKGGPNDDYPQSQSDTTFVKRWYPGENGITYENKIHVRRFPAWRHSNPAARWQTNNEEYIELITPQNDTLYFNSYYDANHIGNRSNEYEDKENQRKLFDKHRNRNVWDDLGW